MTIREKIYTAIVERTIVDQVQVEVRVRGDDVPTKKIEDRVELLAGKISENPILIEDAKITCKMVFLELEDTFELGYNRI